MDTGAPGSGDPASRKDTPTTQDHPYRARSNVSPPYESDSRQAASVTNVEGSTQDPNYDDWLLLPEVRPRNDIS